SLPPVDALAHSATRLLFWRAGSPDTDRTAPPSARAGDSPTPHRHARDPLVPPAPAVPRVDAYPAARRTMRRAPDRPPLPSGELLRRPTHQASVALEPAEFVRPRPEPVTQGSPTQGSH